MKAISEVNNNFSAAQSNNVMTGTSTLTSSVSDIRYKDSIAFELEWTGTPVGTFTVQGCLDFSPSNEIQGIRGPPNAGNWVTITNLADVNGNSLVAAGAPGQILINMTQVGWPYIRVQYTNTSGSGLLTGYMSAKSLG